MRHHLFCAAALALLTLGAAPAQALTGLWTRDGAAPSQAFGATTALTSGGNLLVAGTSKPPGGTRVLTLEAMSSAGQTLFATSLAFASPLADPELGELVVDGAGTAWVFGTVKTGTGPSFLPDRKLFMARFSASTGAHIGTWFGASAYQSLWAKNVVVAGTRVVATAYDINSRHAFVFAFNANGTLGWSRSLYNAQAGSVAAAPDGDIVWAGTALVSINGVFQRDAHLIRYAPNGSARFTRTVDFAGRSETVSDVVVAADNEAYVSGATDSPTVGGARELFVLKFGRRGQARWTHRSPLLHPTVVYPPLMGSKSNGHLTVLNNGDLVVGQHDAEVTATSTGTSTSYTYLYESQITRVAAATGELGWSIRLDGSLRDLATALGGGVLAIDSDADLLELGASDGATLSLTSSAADSLNELEVDPTSGAIFTAGARQDLSAQPYQYWLSLSAFEE